MSKEKRLMLLLNTCFYDPGKVWRKLVESTVDADQVFGDFSCLQSLDVSSDNILKIETLSHENWPERELERCKKANARVLFLGDDDYPDKFNYMNDPPPVLFSIGELPCDGGVSIVGTRRCSSYGMKTAHSLGYYLACASVPVISGGAFGVDGSAHSGAIDGNFHTWAVLGTGVDLVYPRGHVDLFKKIIETGGGLISQFPMGFQGQAWTFPKRNALVAALSDFTVVVESPEKGGSMITARLASAMGKDVWVVPGRIDESVCKGSNRLIFDGAQPLYDIETFIGIVSVTGQLDLFKDACAELDESTKSVLLIIRERGGLTVDKISLESDFPIPSVLESLANLEVKGKVYRSGPGRWSASV